MRPWRGLIAATAAHPRITDRARRIIAGAWALAVAAPPLLLLGGQSLPEEVILPLLVVCWVLILPTASLVMLGFAAALRTVRDARNLLAAVATLLASIALVGPAARAGSEVMLNRHAAALEPLARELAAAPAMQERPRRRLAREGVGLAHVAPEFVAFDHGGPFGWSFLYATGGRGMVDRRAVRRELRCATLRIRSAGGGWYLYDCSGEG